MLMKASEILASGWAEHAVTITTLFSFICVVVGASQIA
jgi:hypothetical protein